MRLDTMDGEHLSAAEYRSRFDREIAALPPVETPQERKA